MQLSYYQLLLALRHCRMATLSPRALSCALVIGLASGCGNAPHPVDKPAPSGSPTIPQPGTTVTGEDIDRAGPSDDAIEKTLAAKVPGVLVTRTPDGGVAVRIRGNSSINGNLEPLYIIDGLAIQPRPGGALVGINPHDIASIEVLKAPASVLFFGV